MIEKKKFRNKTYKVFNNVWYHWRTPDAVIHALDSARRQNKRVRIFLGKAGKVWPETYDCTGTISTSTGPVRIPLLINNRRSMGGGGILTHCVMGIKDHYGFLYRHKNFNLGKFKIDETPVENTSREKYPFSIFHNGSLLYSAENKKYLERKVSFLKGDRLAA